MSEERVRPDFAGIYDDCFSKIYNYVRYRVGDAAVADDVVSRVFERALERFERFDPARGPAEAWLIGIARHAVEDHFRTAGRRSFQPAEEALERAAEPVDARADDRRELLRAIEILDARDREILGLRFGAGMTNRAISDHLALGESHVGVLVYRAIKKLQEALRP